MEKIALFAVMMSLVAGLTAQAAPNSNAVCDSYIKLAFENNKTNLTDELGPLQLKASRLAKLILVSMEPYVRYVTLFSEKSKRNPEILKDVFTLESADIEVQQKVARDYAYLYTTDLIAPEYKGDSAIHEINRRLKKHRNQIKFAKYLGTTTGKLGGDFIVDVWDTHNSEDKDQLSSFTIWSGRPSGEMTNECAVSSRDIIQFKTNLEKELFQCVEDKITGTATPVIQTVFNYIRGQHPECEENLKTKLNSGDFFTNLVSSTQASIQNMITSAGAGTPAQHSINSIGVR